MKERFQMASRLKLAISILALSLALSVSAQAATLIGDSIHTLWSFPPVGTPDPTVTPLPDTFTVGAGVETIFNVEDGTVFVSADFDANSLLMIFTTSSTDLFWLTASQNGPVFTVLSGNAFPSIDSVMTSNGGSIGAYILNGELYVNLSGWHFANGDTATVLFSSSDVTTPLPAALPLFGSILGAGGLIGWMRRRRTTNTAAAAS
jgi:hypothetical protein